MKDLEILYLRPEFQSSKLVMSEPKTTEDLLKSESKIDLDKPLLLENRASLKQVMEEAMRKYDNNGDIDNTVTRQDVNIERQDNDSQSDIIISDADRANERLSSDSDSVLNSEEEEDRYDRISNSRWL